MIIYGSTTYGKVDRIPGLCHVETQFVHVYFFPILPMGSYAIVEGREGEGIKLPLNGKSIKTAWTRAFGFLGTVGFGIALFTTMGGPMTRTLAVVLGLFLSVGIMVGSFLQDEDASYDRACDLIEQLGLGPEAELWVENVYNKLMPGEFEERSAVLAKDREERESAYETRMREKRKAERAEAAERDPEGDASGGAPAKPKKARIIAKGAARFDNKATRPCPECGKEIKAVARLCRFCKVRF